MAFEGYSWPDNTVALKLSRALYGTRQASALWNRLLTELLLELGFEQPLELDNCLFVYDREGTFIMCTLQVDGQLNRMLNKNIYIYKFPLPKL